MKSLLLSVLCLFLNFETLAGVVAPEVEVASCLKSSYLSAPIGRETINIRASIYDPRLTEKPVNVPVKFEFSEGRVHFTSSELPEPRVRVSISTEKNETGYFPGRVTLDGKGVEVDCDTLTDHFRPFPDETIQIRFRYGAEKCLSDGTSCVRMTGGLKSEGTELKLKFRPEKAGLYATWYVDKMIFEKDVGFITTVSKRRRDEGRYNHEFEILYKDHPNPMNVSFQSPSVHQVMLRSPLMNSGEGTIMRVWQRIHVFPTK